MSYSVELSKPETPGLFKQFMITFSYEQAKYTCRRELGEGRAAFGRILNGDGQILFCAISLEFALSGLSEHRNGGQSQGVAI